MKSAWSYSRLSMFEQCPTKYKFKHIDKLKEPDSPAMARGNEIHKMGEEYLQGKLKKVPEPYKLFAKEMKFLKKIKAKSEEQWAFDEDGESVDWFDPTVRLRIKMDAYYRVADDIIVIDFKTGKPHAAEHEDQCKLYACGALLKFPDARMFCVEMWYLDQAGALNTPVKSVFNYTKDQVENLIPRFADRASRIDKEKKFDARPGFQCRWCTFSSTKGGPCKKG